MMDVVMDIHIMLIELLKKQEVIVINIVIVL